MTDNASTASIAECKVLVIDDSKTLRRSAELFLTQAGCQVVLAEDGLDALALLADWTPDVVVCDVAMPRLDGLATCALVKQHPRFKDLPWIMVSSKDSVLDRARAELVGCADYLTKPFTKEQLLRCVARHVVPMGAGADDAAIESP